MTQVGYGSAPGKVILSGEHSAVYGHPAIVAATQLGSRAEISAEKAVPNRAQVHSSQMQLFAQQLRDIYIDQGYIGPEAARDISLVLSTDLPIQSGMGSSASLAVAGFRALADWQGQQLSLDELFSLAMHSEKIMHGNPSGIDPAAVVYQGFLHVQKVGDSLVRKSIEGQNTLPDFFLIQSGTPKETTKEMVAFVAEQARHSQEYRKNIDAIGEVTLEALAALAAGEQNQLLSSLTKNQRLLEEIGVVSDTAAMIIHACERNGATVKVTGAGGRESGSGLLVAFHPDREAFRTFLADQAFTYIETTVLSAHA